MTQHDIYRSTYELPITKDDARNLGDLKIETITEGVLDAGVVIEGVTLKDGTITTTGPNIESCDPALTATGTTYADALALTESINVITGGAANTGVTLPTAVVGQVVRVANLTASAKIIYPFAGDQIDDLTVTTAGCTIQPEAVVTFYCYTVVKWQSDFEADGVYSTLYVDTIGENASAAGVTIDNVTVRGETNAISLINGTSNVGLGAAASVDLGAAATLDLGAATVVDIAAGKTVNIDDGLTVNGGFGTVLASTGQENTISLARSLTISGTHAPEIATTAAAKLTLSGITGVLTTATNALTLASGTAAVTLAAGDTDIALGAGAQLDVAAATTVNIDKGLTVNGAFGTVLASNGQQNTITLNENLTVGDGYAVSITAEDAIGSIVLDEQTFEVEGEGTATQLFKLINSANAAATLTYQGTNLAIVSAATTLSLTSGTASITLGAAGVIDIAAAATVNVDNNLTVNGGFGTTITSEDAAGSITLDEQTFEVEGEGTATQLFKLVNGANAAATLTYSGTNLAITSTATTLSLVSGTANVTLGAAGSIDLGAAATLDLGASTVVDIAASKTVNIDNNVTIQGDTSITAATTIASATSISDAMTEGTGISGGSGTVYHSIVEREGKFIKTVIFVDIQGLASVADDGDAIGTANPSHLGQVTAAVNGAIYKASITCLEAPATGNTDIDVYSNASGSIQVDGDVSGGTQLLDKSGAWSAVEESALTALPAADEYLYLTAGSAGAADTYTAGQFVIELFGVDVT